MNTIVAAYLIIFSIGDDSGIRMNAFEMSSMDMCMKAVAASRLNTPDGGDMEISGGVICVESLQGAFVFSDTIRPRSE